MPSPAATALEAGFTALLASSGEDLVLSRPGVDDVEVVGLVNRSPLGVPVPGTISLKPHDASEIEILAGSIATIPVTGDIFSDIDGINHRVQFVQRLGIAIKCKCRTS